MPKPPARRPVRASFSDSVRDLIDRDPRAPTAIAVAAGLAPSVLSRFLSGERGLNSSSLDALVPVLGLVLTGATNRGVSRAQKRRRAAEVPSVDPLPDNATAGLQGDEAGDGPCPSEGGSEGDAGR